MEREKRLETEREFIQKSLNAVDDIFYYVDTEGNFQRWNETLSELTGYNDEEIGAMNALDFFDGEHRSVIEEAMRDILKNGSNVTEAAITTKDGEQITHEFRGVRMTNDAGEPTGIIGISRDITARKKREAKLVAERDRLDEFAGIISHDLCNLLGTAEGWMDVVRADCDSPHIDDIEITIDRAQKLIDDLLTLARNGDTVGEFEPFPLKPLIDECQQILPDDQATVVIDENLTISANECRLQQLFENLFMNSVDHGGDDITITIGRCDGGFYVADDGIGIPEIMREDIFDPGYSTDDDGTGLGLRIVQQIVEAHEWEIEATESENGGAKFEITSVDVVE